MDKELIDRIDRIGNTIGGISGEIDDKADSLCARLNGIKEELYSINSGMCGIEHVLERIAYALERKNEWEKISRPSLSKSDY